MRPRRAQIIVERRRAQTGTSYRGLTFFQALENGMPPSRLKAQVQREAAVREPTAAKNQMPRTGMSGVCGSTY